MYIVKRISHEKKKFILGRSGVKGIFFIIIVMLTIKCPPLLDYFFSENNSNSCENWI